MYHGMAEVSLKSSQRSSIDVLQKKKKTAGRAKLMGGKYLPVSDHEDRHRGALGVYHNVA